MGRVGDRKPISASVMLTVANVALLEARVGEEGKDAGGGMWGTEGAGG